MSRANIDIETSIENYGMHHHHHQHSNNHSAHNQEIYRSNIHIDDDYIRNQVHRKIPFEEEIIIGKAIRTNANFQLTVEDISEMDSGFQSRAESVTETLKKGIFKQAQNINNITLVSPKLQRINDSVTKVFGLNDPPPGFGLCYPKYYYLEQKRPQPMSPLKVWRGFNGNIYFEPIVCNNLNRAFGFKQSSQFDGYFVPELSESITKNPSNINNTNSSNNNLGLKKANSFTVSDVRQKETDSSDQEVINTINNNNNNSNNQPLFIRNKTLSPSLFPNLLNASQINGQNIIAQNISQKELETMNIISPPNNTKNFVKLNANSPSMKIKTSTNNSPSSYTNKDYVYEKLKKSHSFVHHSANSTSRFETKQILPNLSAVKKHNSPMRGLAYKEVKNRISPSEFSNESIQQLQQLQMQLQQQQSSNSTPIKNIQLDNDKRGYNPAIDFGLANSNSTEAFSPKPSYKQMLKGIKKGVTVNSYIKAQAQSDLNNGYKGDVKFVEIKPDSKSSSPEEHNESNNSNKQQTKQADTSSSQNLTVRDKQKLKLSNSLNIKGDRLLKSDFTPSHSNNNSNTSFYRKINKEELVNNLSTIDDKSSQSKANLLFSSSNSNINVSTSSNIIITNYNLTFRRTNPTPELGDN